MTPERARAFALAAHGDQLYGSHPYGVHLEAVADLVVPFGDTAQIIAYLHDVVEDTGVSLDDVRAEFGDLVAECVDLLTDQPGANRKERKAKTYARLAQVRGPREIALVVKVGDRLANVSSCIADDLRAMWEMYRGEHAVFRSSAYRPGLCEGLWGRLDRLLVAWV